MSVDIAKSVAGALMAITCIAQFASSVQAQGYYLGSATYGYNPYYSPYSTAINDPYTSSYGYNSYYTPYRKPSVFTSHPILTGTLLGTTVGAAGGLAVGALQSGESKSGEAIGIDTAIGAGAGAALGAGVGLIRNKRITGFWF
jgi:hypothetical protein